MLEHIFLFNCKNSLQFYNNSIYCSYLISNIPSMNIMLKLKQLLCFHVPTDRADYKIVKYYSSVDNPLVWSKRFYTCKKCGKGFLTNKKY